MRLLGAVCAALLGLTLGAAPAAATGDGAGDGAGDGGEDFLVAPAPDSATAADGDYFVLEAGPGDVVTQSVELRNDSGSPIDLQLKAVDAVTGPLGGASYGLPTDEVTRTGTWITLDRTDVHLEADGSASIPFTVRVPDDAGSGEHLAGLSVASVEADTPATGNDAGTGASVDVRTRRVVAVQVDVPGPAEPELSITGVRAVARPQGLYLEIDIDHVGTALTSGEGTVSLRADDFQRDFTFDTFVPGTSIAYPIEWTTDAQDGSYPASVELRYDGRTATWNGDVLVGEQVLNDLTDRQVQTTNDPADPGTGPAAWIPWVTAALGVLAAGAVAYRLGRRSSSSGADRRRGRESADV